MAPRSNPLAGLLARFRALPVAQQALLGAGVPLVAGAAVIQNVRARSAGSTGAGSTGTSSTTGTDTVGSDLSTADLGAGAQTADAIYGLNVAQQQAAERFQAALAAQNDRAAQQAQAVADRLGAIEARLSNPPGYRGVGPFGMRDVNQPGIGPNPAPGRQVPNAPTPTRVVVDPATTPGSFAPGGARVLPVPVLPAGVTRGTVTKPAVGAPAPTQAKATTPTQTQIIRRLDPQAQTALIGAVTSRVGSTTVTTPDTVLFRGEVISRREYADRLQALRSTPTSSSPKPVTSTSAPVTTTQTRTAPAKQTTQTGIVIDPTRERVSTKPSIE